MTADQLLVGSSDIVDLDAMRRRRWSTGVFRGELLSGSSQRFTGKGSGKPDPLDVWHRSIGSGLGDSSVVRGWVEHSLLSEMICRSFCVATNPNRQTGDQPNHSEIQTWRDVESSQYKSSKDSPSPVSMWFRVPRWQNHHLVASWTSAH